MGRSGNDVPGALLHNTIAPVMRERPLSVGKASRYRVKKVVTVWNVDAKPRKSSVYTSRTLRASSMDQSSERLAFVILFDLEHLGYVILRLALSPAWKFGLKPLDYVMCSLTDLHPSVTCGSICAVFRGSKQGQEDKDTQGVIYEFDGVVVPVFLLSEFAKENASLYVLA
ncbi:hypothetical protein Tco_1346838 [Tanacetum coccineum]